jgi:hypothetical protein
MDRLALRVLCGGVIAIALLAHAGAAVGVNVDASSGDWCDDDAPRLPELGASASVQVEQVIVDQAPVDQATPFMRAIDRAAEKSDNPERTRGTLISRFRFSPFCYPNDLTDQQLDELMRTTQLLPPTQSRVQPRFELDVNAWLGDLTTTSSGSSRRARLTYSFPPDGTTWGNACSSINLTGPNDLNAKLTARFGTLDKGREMVRSSLAAWRRYAGLTYAEVTDDGAPFDLSSTRVATRGDIRIGGFGFGAIGSSPLAYNGFPTSGGISNCGGGDMVLNTLYFKDPATTSPPYYFGNAAADALYFRNTVAHEHGHGLGLIHTVPCNLMKIMEPVIYDTRALLGKDDIRAAQRNYGDRYQGNQSSATAKDFGNLTTPILKSVIEKDLSINGTAVSVPPSFLPTEDWFKFTLSSTRTVTITVTPTGDSCTGSCSGGSTDPGCCVGRQASNCSGTVGLVQANQAGNLGVELRNGTDTAQIALSNTAVAGQPETITISLAAGTYFVRVFDNGGQPSTNQVVQTYDLLVRLPSTLANPVAIAGIDKLATASQPTYFIGDHNSYATETGASLILGNTSWDLDGDGVFETTNQAQTSTVYVSNGTYPVRLRVVDSNSKSATDTINVTVRGATTTITGALPSGGARGTAIPVTIVGTNFKGVTSSSQISVSGTGITVSGTPMVNGMGTQISGLTFTIAAGATLGARDITVINSDGLGANGTGTGAFTVLTPSTNDECAVPTNLGSATGSFPLELRNATTSLDQNCSTTITNDVWFTWTAPASGDLTIDTTGAFTGNIGAYSGTACQVGAPVSCSDAMGPITISMLNGQTVLIRVGGLSPNPAFAGTLVLGFSGTVGTGACCAADGSCSVTLSTSCSGSFLGGACSPNPCPQPMEACCFTNGTCSMLTSSACVFAGGIAQGASSSCTPNTCPQPSGVCCRGTVCTITTSAQCTVPNGMGIGATFSAGGVCNANGSMQTPCCYADFDKSGAPSIDDIFIFLNAWFSSSPYADVGGDGTGTPNLDDVFIFLNTWFAGC